VSTVARSPTGRRTERGQASVEFVALVFLSCLAFGALLALKGGFDGRDVGGFLARHFVCAVSRRCDRHERRLVAAYGERDAAAVRALAPNLVYEPGERELPVDWRECRRVACSVAPDDPALDAHVPDQPGPPRAGRWPAGRPRATAFTHVLRRDGRLYIQYWLYYADSSTTLAGSDRLWVLSGLPFRYPGFHEDDWEGAFVRVDPDGSTWLRASSHGHFQSCKWGFCRGEWARHTGWVRVSRGSHSGHIPFDRELRWRTPAVPQGGPRYLPLPDRPRLIPLWPGHGLHERSTTGEGIRLVPLELLDPRRYRARDRHVLPPWDKDAYLVPTAGKS
jgi:hypothetical protein